MTIKLFGKGISPACKYCENGHSDKNGERVICAKKGGVDPDFSCKSFVYAPLKRVPHALPPLQKYEAEDFKL